MKRIVLHALAAVVLVGMVTAWTGCPPLMMLPPTVSLKLSNTGETPIVSLFMTVTDLQDWGPNLLNQPLEPHRYIIIEQLPREDCHIRVDFDTGPVIQTRCFYDVPAPPPGFDFTTWYAYLLADGESYGIGYAWGYQEYEGETVQE